MYLLTYLLTDLCPSTRWKHGPSMKALHWILHCATVTISRQVYPIVFTSDSMSRRQVFLGRPLFLFMVWSSKTFAFSLTLQANYNYKIFDCLTPNGAILPGETAKVEWKFSPLEAKMYTVRKQSVASNYTVEIDGGVQNLILQNQDSKLM